MISYIEWDESIVSVLLDCLLELVTSETEVVIRLNVPQLDQTNQTSLLHAGVSLVRAVANQTRVDLSILDVRKHDLNNDHETELYQHLLYLIFLDSFSPGCQETHEGALTCSGLYHSSSQTT